MAGQPLSHCLVGSPQPEEKNWIGNSTGESNFEIMLEHKSELSMLCAPKQSIPTLKCISSNTAHEPWGGIHCHTLARAGEASHRVLVPLSAPGVKEDVNGLDRIHRTNIKYTKRLGKHEAGRGKACSVLSDLEDG